MCPFPEAWKICLAAWFCLSQGSLTGAVSAADDIRRAALTVLRDRCLGCHNERKSEGGYDLSRLERLAVAGDSGKSPIVADAPNKSELFRRLTTEDASERMPSGAGRLSDKEIDTIRAWLTNASEHHSSHTGYLVDWIEGDNPALPLSREPVLATYERFPFPIFAFDTNGRMLYVAGTHEVLVWDLNQQRLVNRWTGLGRYVSAIAIDPTTGTVAIASGKPGAQGSVHLVFPSNVEVAYRLATLPDVPVALSFSPKDSKIAIGGMDGAIKVYDSQVRTKLYDALGHADQVLSIQWNRDGSQFATASRDRTCRVYDARSFQLQTSYSGHERAVGSVAFARSAIVSLDETGTLRAWSKTDSDKLLVKRTGLPQRLQSIAVRSDEITWLDERSLETVIIEIREETEKADKPEDKPKKKKVYQFKSLQSFPVETSRIAHWAFLLHETDFVYSTRDGWFQRLDLRHLSPSHEVSVADLMRLFPASE